MTEHFKLLTFLVFLLSNFLAGSLTWENFPPVHHSMVELYQEMTSISTSTSNVHKVLAIAGKVTFEDPCRVRFKIPQIHQPKNVLKIDLHIKTLGTDLKDNGKDVVDIAILEDYSKIKIIAIKLIRVQKFSKIDIARFLLHPVQHTIEVWIGSRQKRNQIECSKENIERPTVLIHYRKEKFSQGSIPQIVAVTKREVSSIKDDVNTELSSNCQRSDFFINFSDLGWNRWIISPTGYQAGGCTGHCHAPLADGTQPTNYARIMSALMEVGLAGAVGPQCVPSVLEPLPLLLHGKSGNVILKLYEDMVVSECSCK